jgi:hypothetical protein
MLQAPDVCNQRLKMRQQLAYTLCFHFQLVALPPGGGVLLPQHLVRADRGADQSHH